MPDIVHLSGEYFHPLFKIVVLSGKQATKRKSLVDFEAKPPACGRCVWYMAEHRKTDATPYRPPYCIKNKFLLQGSYGICNLWESKSGETLT